MSPRNSVPIAVELDGTLVRTHTLVEAALLWLRCHPSHVLYLVLWLLRGRSHMSRELAQRVTLDPTSLPYRHDLLSWLSEQHARGRRLLLVTHSGQAFARTICSHLGIFHDVLPGDGAPDLSASRKAALLTGRFGDRGFDYVGTSLRDLPVWSRARRAILVAPSPTLRRAVGKHTQIDREFPEATPRLRTWLRALRLHHWAKNLLLFLPLVAAHLLFHLPALAKALLAFLSFGLCASALYVLNDLLDLSDDRLHPFKRTRPFAAGQLSPLTGLAVAPLLLAVSAALARSIGMSFFLWLTAYLLLTIAYSFSFKRMPLLDVLSLASLYTLRVLAGGAATAVPVSFWLLALSLFLFLSLAFVKRSADLRIAVRLGAPSTSAAGYLPDDLPLIQAIGIASGFLAVLVLALYINSDSVLQLYRRPQLLWFALPVLLYWLTHMWLQVHRGRIEQDPVLFAIRDPSSIASGVLLLLIVWLAT